MGKEKAKGGAQRLKLNIQWLKRHESVLLPFHIALSHQIRPFLTKSGRKPKALGWGWAGGEAEKRMRLGKV